MPKRQALACRSSCLKVPLMRHALPLALAALILGGCASHKPEDYNGTWINQKAIDAAAKGESLRNALASNGPVFEWKINVAGQQASYMNGVETVDGRLLANDKQWQATFEGGQSEQLSLSGNELQTTDASGARQTFIRSTSPEAADATVGSSFEKTLYQTYLGGEWTITEGPGQGAKVRFGDDGSVTGLPALDRYALCLAGDCATIGNGNDSLWLERDQQGGPWIFRRSPDRLEIFRAVNRAQPDDMPQLAPGPRQWVLQRN